MPPPAPSRDAADRSRGRRRRLHAGLHQPDLRPPPPSVAATDRRPSLPGGAGRGLGAGRRCRSGSRRDVAGSCCGTPWGSKGYRRGAACDGERTIDRALALDRRGRAAGRDRRDVVHAGLLEAAERARRSGRRAARRAEIIDSIEWARRLLLTELEVGERARHRRSVHPTCLADHLGLDTATCAELAGALAEEVVVPAVGDLLRLRRRPRVPAPGADRLGDGARGGRGRRAARPTPTSAPTAPARSACERETGRDYESFVYLLERADRPLSRAGLARRSAFSGR